MGNVHLNDIELFEYASGELSGAEQARAEQHISACEECRSLLTLARAGGDALRGAPRFELPVGVLERTLGSLGRQELEPGPARTRFTLRRALSVLAPAAAIAGVVVVVVFAARSGDDSASESAAPAPAAAADPAPAAADPAPAEAPSTRQLEQAEAFDEAPADAAAAEPEALSDVGGAEEAEAAPAPAPEPAPEPEPDPAPAPPADPAPAAADPLPAVEPEAVPQPATPSEGGPTSEADPPISDTDEFVLLARVAGPADDVLALLASAGIDAVVAEDGSIEVAEADADAAIELLGARAEGELPVRVVLELAP